MNHFCGAASKVRSYDFIKSIVELLTVNGLLAVRPTKPSKFAGPQERLKFDFTLVLTCVNIFSLCIPMPGIRHLRPLPGIGRI